MNDEKQMITIDGKEYDFEELEDNQKAMVNHVASLNSLNCGWHTSGIGANISLA